MTGSTRTEKHHSLRAGILIVMHGPVLVFRSWGKESCHQKKAAMSFCKQWRLRNCRFGRLCGLAQWMKNAPSDSSAPKQRFA
jgi:hypothetical protein